MKIEERIKLFAMSQQMLDAELNGIEARFSVDLGRHPVNPVEQDKDYYPQFDEAVRKEAAQMSRHYELFYCLETSARAIVKAKMLAEHGSNWWIQKVPPAVRENAEKNALRERDSAVTARSDDMLDYTTFGELGEIVRANWATFNDTFNSEKAFTRVMSGLNLLRGPIAHCSPLASDEIDRLSLTLRDWFRLME